MEGLHEIGVIFDIMTYFNDVQVVGRTASSRTYYFVILCLVSYILLDFVLHHSSNSECADLVLDAAKARWAAAWP